MKWLGLILMVPSLAFAGGPRSTFPDPRGMDAEMNNIYHDIANPVINIGSASTMTITQLNVSTVTAINVVVSSLVANNFTATASTFTALKVTGAAIIPWMTDWKSDLTFTPNSACFGTISKSSFTYRRVGDSIEVAFRFKCGTVGGTACNITMPNGIVIDNDKMYGDPTVNTTGVGVYNTTNGAGGAGTWTIGIGGAIYHDMGGSTTVNFSRVNGSDAAGNIYTSASGTQIGNNNGWINGRFSVPIVGWTTGN